MCIHGEVCPKELLHFALVMEKLQLGEVVLHALSLNSTYLTASGTRIACRLSFQPLGASFR